MTYDVKAERSVVVEETDSDLRVRTKDFALRIISLFSSLPKETKAQVLGKQILRSGTSVGANYREAFRARSDSEFVAKIGICLQELDETSYWLELISESEVFPQTRLSSLFDETNQLIAIFTTISKRTKQRMRTQGK